MDVDPDHDRSYIEKNAIFLPTAIFPCTIRYTDLTSLNLTHFTRTPKLMLLRIEWGSMIEIFNKQKKGIEGGVVFTGQPGIGECYYCFELVLL